MQHNVPEVGPWAREKLEALASYLDFYTKVLKNQHWRTIYLDAFAGGGRSVVRPEERSDHSTGDLFIDDHSSDADMRELIDGSPRVALGVANPFDRYVFADPDPARAIELKALQQEFLETREIVALQTTAAEGIAWVAAQPISRITHRGIAFLDPFGANLDWASVQKLADTKLFEVVINFPLGMALQRMLPNNGEVPPSWAAKLDCYFGSREWFGEVYVAKLGGLFVEKGFEKRADYSERLLQLYRTSLEQAFGHVSKPRQIRNTRGVPLYYLVWAGPHKTGLKGANYILAMGKALKGE